LTSIAVVTPWHAHLELADDYFEAVLPEMEEGDECIVVDNASDPPLQFAAVTSVANLGYCGGSNLGLRAAQAEAVLFLNNDVALGERGWLAEIREALEPGVLVGPLRTHAMANAGAHVLPYIDGWCLAGMRLDLLALGGFDETLMEPAYFSDNLLCLEARAAGMTLREVRVGLRHKENVTAGTQFDPLVRAATEANRERYGARVRELLVAVN
jgi:GT2 family glycosyltransferase